MMSVGSRSTVGLSDSFPDSKSEHEDLCGLSEWSDRWSNLGDGLALPSLNVTVLSLFGVSSFSWGDGSRAE